MNKDIKQFLVQLIGPYGLVIVKGKPQQFIEEATSRIVLERRITDRKMDIDPVAGSALYSGRYIGCWIHIQELPDPQETLNLETYDKDRVANTREWR